MRKNKGLFIGLLMAIVVTTGSLFFFSSEGHAYSFQNPTVLSGLNVCPDTEGLTVRIVVCVKESILYAVNSFLGPFSSYLQGFVFAACSLAVAVWGGLMAVGKQSAPVKDASVTFIKIGAVVMFTNNFGGLFGAFLDMMEYMLAAVLQYVLYSPSFECDYATLWPSTSISGTSLEVWALVDCSLDALIGGIFSPWMIALGISSFLLSMLFSQAIGLFVGLVGFLIIAQLIWAIVRGLYIFLSAYIAFALMAVISPLFIPMILFQATKGYFEKWLRITMGFMLQPIFLFTYLAMLMAAYDVVVYTGPNSLYRIIAGDDVDDPTFKIGLWAFANGVYGESSQSSQGYNVDPKLTTTVDIGETNVGTIGEGKDDAQLDVKLVEQITDPVEWIKTNKLPRDILAEKLVGGAGFGPGLGYFRVDLPVEAIDWETFASIHGYDPTDENELKLFWVDLILSIVMALLIAYVFLLLLDLLPFIGSGVAGDILSMPAFGTGPFAPPGDGAVMGIKDRLMGNIIGSRT